MDISNLTQQQKVETLQALYHDVAGQGREGDTQLAHINSQEAALLRALGGSGTLNPNTGLPEYKPAAKAVKSVGKAVGKVAKTVVKTATISQNVSKMYEKGAHDVSEMYSKYIQNVLKMYPE